MGSVRTRQRGTLIRDDRMALFVSILSKSMRAHHGLTSSTTKEE